MSAADVERMLAAAGNYRIGDYGLVAERLGVPLWVLFIPNLPRVWLQPESLRRLVAHVETFVAAGPPQS